MRRNYAVEEARKNLNDDVLSIIKNPGYETEVDEYPGYSQEVDFNGPKYYEDRCELSGNKEKDATIEWWKDAEGTYIQKIVLVALVIAEETYRNVSEENSIDRQPLTALSGDARDERIADLLKIAKLPITRELAIASINWHVPLHVDEFSEYGLTVLGMLL